MNKLWDCDYQDAVDRNSNTVTFGERYGDRVLTPEQREAQEKAYHEAVNKAWKQELKGGE
jgi:hypothetical protein